jgi:hypothetical protein
MIGKATQDNDSRNAVLQALISHEPWPSQVGREYVA